MSDYGRSADPLLVAYRGKIIDLSSALAGEMIVDTSLDKDSAEAPIALLSGLLGLALSAAELAHRGSSAYVTKDLPRGERDSLARARHQLALLEQYYGKA